MGVKGSPANVRAFNDFPHSNLVEVLFRQKRCKRLEYCLSRLFLPSIHAFSPYILVDLFGIEQAAKIMR
jgi:hypothetical protein